MDHYFTNNQNLKSELRDITYSYEDKDFSFVSDNGVFSKDRIDYGSRFLLECYLKSNKVPYKVLDLGCGIGFMGIVLSKMLGSNIVMSDVNKRALHLAKMNCDKNKVKAEIIESNVYEKIDDKFDLIITNPPVRAGKNILLDFLKGASNYLSDNGELWYVLRKNHGAKSMMEYLKDIYEIQIVDKSNGFYIFCCKKR